MPNKRQESSDIVAHALTRYQAGLDPALIELPEAAVFPGLIPAQPATARKARRTGQLLGRPAPVFIKRGRLVRYRLKDVLAWLDDAPPAYHSTAEAIVARLNTPETETEGHPEFLS